eukprot:3054813-Amphidinium_carterae.1
MADASPSGHATKECFAPFIASGPRELPESRVERERAHSHEPFQVLSFLGAASRIAKQKDPRKGFDPRGHA